MSPMLRGEALPLPRKELDDLRARLPRQYGDLTVSTAGGPVLVIRIPDDEPDFLRDLEAAAERVPYRDLREHRGVVLLGDSAAMGVSADMFANLLTDRRSSEERWVGSMRTQLGPGASVITRMPEDPHRRLRAVFRVDQVSVQDLDEDAFDRMAMGLPELKHQSPGGARPVYAHLVASSDDVRIDAGPFFTELEKRYERVQQIKVRAMRMKQEERHHVAVHEIDRIAGTLPKARATLPRRRTTAEVLSDVRRHLDEVRSGSLDERSDAPPGPALDDPTVTKAVPPEAARPREGSPRSDIDSLLGDVPRAPRRRAVRSDRLDAPALSSTVELESESLDCEDSLRAREDPLATRLFQPLSDAPGEATSIRAALETAGYRLRERFLVQGMPVAFAGARDRGYPKRVLVSFWDRLDPEDARRLIKMGRSVGVELLMAIAKDVPDESRRVALATSLKIVPFEAAMDVRLS